MTSKPKNPCSVNSKLDKDTKEGSYCNRENNFQEGADDQGCKHKDRKRIVHNEVERRRKDKINAWILRIGQLLPFKSNKQNKNGILENAAAYIVNSQKTNEKLLMGKCSEVQAELVKNLRKQIHTLEEQVKRYEKLLESEGIPLSADPSTGWLSKVKSDSGQTNASTSAADTTQVTSSCKNDPPCSQIEATSTSGDLAFVQAEATSSSKKKSRNTISCHLESLKSKSKDGVIISTIPSGLEVLQTGQMVTNALSSRAVIQGTSGIATIAVNPGIVRMSDGQTPLNATAVIGSNAVVAPSSNLMPLSQILNPGSMPVMMNQNGLIFLSPSSVGNGGINVTTKVTPVQNATNILVANNQLSAASAPSVLSTAPQQAVLTKQPELHAVSIAVTQNIAKPSPSIITTSAATFNPTIQQDDITQNLNPSSTAVTQSLDGQPIMSTNQGNGILHIPAGASVSFIQGSHVPVGMQNSLQPIIFVNEQGTPIIQSVSWPPNSSQSFMVPHSISQDSQSDGQSLSEMQELSQDCSHLGMPVINFIPQTNSSLQANNLADSRPQQSLKITQFGPQQQVANSYINQTSTSQVMPQQLTQQFVNQTPEKQIQQLVEPQTPISITINQSQHQATQIMSQMAAPGLTQQQLQQYQIQQQQQVQQQMQQQQLQTQQLQQQTSQQSHQQQVQQHIQQQIQQQQQLQAQQQNQQIFQQQLQTSQVYIPTAQPQAKNTTAPSLTFANQNGTETVLGNSQSLTPGCHSQPNQTQGNVLSQAVHANQHGQYLTVNNSSGGSNLPSALILPNGQIIPVVSQPSLLYPHSAPINSSLLVTTSASVNSNQVQPLVMSQAATMPETMPTASTSISGKNIPTSNQNHQQNTALNSGLLTTVSLSQPVVVSQQQANNPVTTSPEVSAGSHFAVDINPPTSAQVHNVETTPISTSIITTPSESIVTATSTIQNSTTTTQSNIPLTTPIMITIPPHSNNLNTLFSSNTMTDSCNKKPTRKKITQRAIKPKPVTSQNSGNSSSQISHNVGCSYPTVGNNSSGYSVSTSSAVACNNSNHMITDAAVTGTEISSQTATTACTSESNSVSNISTSQSDSISNISNSSFSSSSSSQATEPLTITTDILAKATESIFSNSLSDPSPPIGNFYNTDPSDFGITSVNDSENTVEQSGQSEFISFDQNGIMINSKSVSEQHVNKNAEIETDPNEQMNLNDVLKQVNALSEKAKTRKSKSNDSSNEPNSKRTKKTQSERRASTSSGNRSRSNSVSKESSVQIHTMSMDNSGNIFLTTSSNSVSQSPHNVTIARNISNISTTSPQLTKSTSADDQVFYNLAFSTVQNENNTSNSQIMPQIGNNSEMNLANSYHMGPPGRRHSSPIIDGMKSPNMQLPLQQVTNTSSDSNAALTRLSPSISQSRHHQGNLRSPVRDVVMNNIISQAMSIAKVKLSNNVSNVNNQQLMTPGQQIMGNSYCGQPAPTNPIFTCSGTITYPGNNPNANPLMLSPMTLQSQADENTQNRTYDQANSAHSNESSLQIETNPNNMNKNITDVNSMNNNNQNQNGENRVISTPTSRHNNTALRVSCSTIMKPSNHGHARRNQATPEVQVTSQVPLTHHSPNTEQQSPTVPTVIGITNYSTEALLGDGTMVKESQYIANQKMVSHGKQDQMNDNQKHHILTSQKSAVQSIVGQHKTLSTQGVTPNRTGISYSAERLLHSPTTNKRTCNTRSSNNTICDNSISCNVAATSSASNFLVNSIALTTTSNVFSSATNTSLTTSTSSHHSFPFYSNHPASLPEQQTPSSTHSQPRNSFHHFPNQNRLMDHGQQGIQSSRSGQLEVPSFSYTQSESNPQNATLSQQANNEMFGNLFNFSNSRMGDELLSPQGINQHKDATNPLSSQNQMNSFIQHSNFHTSNQMQHNPTNKHFVRPPFENSFVQQQTFQVMNSNSTFEQMSPVQQASRNNSSSEETRKTMNMIDKSKTIQTQSKPKSKKTQNQKKSNKQFQEESEVNLSTSIFEPSRSVTPYFPIPNLSPPRNDAPTYIPNNLFASPSRPVTNSSLPGAPGKTTDNNAPYNSLFASRSRASLGLNFQPSFGMKIHGNGGTSTQITSHSTSVTVTPHVPNFNLSNLFPDINTSGTEGINISPIKFHPGNPILPPPQPGMDPNALQHHQPGTLYHNRPHPPVLHNAMSINSILGHNPHGFEARPQVAMGINSSMAPPFHGHGHTPSFSNVIPTLNFAMHEH